MRSSIYRKEAAFILMMKQSEKHIVMVLKAAEALQSSSQNWQIPLSSGKKRILIRSLPELSINSVIHRKILEVRNLDIYIKWDSDKKGFLLPINPEGFELTDSMNNTSVIVHNLGEINLKGKRSLWTITLESFFPHQKYSFSRGAYHDPYEYYIKKLKKLFEKNITIHLIITQTSINGFFTIESFTYGNKEKNGDVSYSLSLKEFREIKSSSVKKKKTTKKIYGGSGAAGAGSSSRVTKTPQTGVYVWKKGDTWQKVTKKCLGSSETWKITKQRNATVIKKAKKKHPKKKENAALIGYKVVVLDW